jgi:hypothetical protein
MSSRSYEGDAVAERQAQRRLPRRRSIGLNGDMRPTSGAARGARRSSRGRHLPAQPAERLCLSASPRGIDSLVVRPRRGGASTSQDGSYGTSPFQRRSQRCWKRE